jgi:hypothetical protein
MAEARARHEQPIVARDDRVVAALRREQRCPGRRGEHGKSMARALHVRAMSAWQDAHASEPT